MLTNKLYSFGTAIAKLASQSQSFLFPTGHCNAIETESDNVSLNRDIYPNLKLRMYTTGIRQNRLARMLGIHEASLSRIMNGFREPTGDIRVHLAEILQSDPDWLFYKMQISDEVAFAENQFAVHQ
jgi:plasmid maintenance system antidote protein VapI